MLVASKVRSHSDHTDGVVGPGLDHPVHQLPLLGDRVELQDLIRTTKTSWIFITKVFNSN